MRIASEIKNELSELVQVQWALHNLAAKTGWRQVRQCRPRRLETRIPTASSTRSSASSWRIQVPAARGKSPASSCLHAGVGARACCMTVPDPPRRFTSAARETCLRARFRSRRVRAREAPAAKAACE